MIKHIGIRLSLADLGPYVFEYLEKTHHDRYGFIPSTHAGRNWGAHVAAWLRDVWFSKISWVKLWEDLDDLVLETFLDERLVLIAKQLGKGEGEVVGGHSPRATEGTRLARFDRATKRLVDKACVQVFLLVEEKVNDMGWGKFVNRLVEGRWESVGL